MITNSSTGCAHARHHVPGPAWADKYKGKFDQGWELRLARRRWPGRRCSGSIPADAKLTPRDPAFPAWDSLPADQRKLYARQMEVFAGFQENADYEIGRVIESIEDLGQADNTLILYIWGDNGLIEHGGDGDRLVQRAHHAERDQADLGAAAQADRRLRRHRRLGRAELSAALRLRLGVGGQFRAVQWGKQVALPHFGGMRDPMVIAWPKRIKDKGGLRTQFTHCIDIVPTILEACGGYPAPDGRKRDRATYRCTG